MQNSAKFTNFRQSEYIVGILSLQASSCNHFYHKNSFFRRKVQIFVGGQNELTMVTLMQNSAKFTNFRQCEHIFGIVSLQASSCILFYHKMSIFRRKGQIFVGGQSELFLVTLMQNGAKFDKFCQREHIFGSFSLQAWRCIHFYRKMCIFCRKVQLFVGGQNELTLVTLMQNSEKSTNFVKENTFSAILAFNHLVASFRTQNYSIFAEECKFW